MKTIMVTGGAGFIGSNFIKFILHRYPDYKVVNVDSLTYAGNLKNLEEIADNRNYIFIKADIRNREEIDKIFSTYTITSLINFAAETHVDRSIEDPEAFLTTNIIGTQILLDTAKKYWGIDNKNQSLKKYKTDTKFIQISTDEVYGALGDTGKFAESMSLMPNNPYSASKAGAEMLVRSYYKTYGLPVIITRCSNNYGPYQYPEKLIPLCIKNCLENKELPVYGDGMQVRDWIHVLDHCSAIDTVLHKGEIGEVYNIGANNERANIEIVKLILKALEKPESLIKYVEDRQGHDRRYALDNTKISENLNWKPQYTFEQGIKDSIQWYTENRSWMY